MIKYLSKKIYTPSKVKHELLIKQCNLQDGLKYYKPD
jgi:hypothetical protein